MVLDSETEIINIVKKYSIANIGTTGLWIDKNAALSRIWSFATLKLKLADELFAKESASQ